MCADGRWSKGNKWVGRSSRAEVEAKFSAWVRHLSAGVAEGSNPHPNPAPNPDPNPNPNPTPSPNPNPNPNQVLRRVAAARASSATACRRAGSRTFSLDLPTSHYISLYLPKARWFQNDFVFCTRPFGAALPPSVVAHHEALTLT